MKMYESFEEIRMEGRTEAQARALLTVLRVRGIAVPAAVRKRIRAEKQQKKLERWLEKASVASSIEEVIGGARGHREPPRRTRAATG